MRVALLTNFIPPYRLSLYRAIAEQAGELRIFVSTTMEKTRSWVPDWTGLDVVLQRTLTFDRTWGTAQFRDIVELHIPYDTLPQLRRWSPDVIITGEFGARTIQAISYGAVTGTPVVVWATLSDRLEAARSGLVHAFRRRLLRRAAAVIANGESGARYIRRLGVGEDRLLRVPYTTDMSALFALPIDKPGLELLYIGAMSPRKGIDKFLEGVEIYARTHPGHTIRLTLIGEGPLQETLERRVMSQNVSLRWVGHVAYNELPQWFATASVFVFPTLGDEWGVVVNEALAAGLPVLGSTYSQAVEELVRDGENGWLFQPDSSDSITAALGRVYATPTHTLARMRTEARATARGLEPDAAAAKIVNLLEKLTRTREPVGVPR